MELVYRASTAILAVIFMGRSLHRLFPPQPKRWKRFGLYALLYATNTLPCWVGDENPILMLPFFMVGFLVFLEGERLFRLVMGGIFYTLFISTNMLLDTLYYNNLTILIVMVIKMLLWCALAGLIWRIVPEGGLRLSKKLWLLVGGLTLAPLVAVLSFSIWGNNFIVEEEFQFYFGVLRRFGFTILPFALVSALTLLAAMVVLSRHEALEQEHRLATLREVYYASLKQEQTQLRTLRHDLRNHVAAIQGLLEQGKQTEITAYLTQLSDSPALDSGKQYTANEAANVVLSSKAAQITAAGLIPDFEAILPVMLPIPAPELCALLSNALDNAMEGAAKSENQTIQLRVRVEKGVFMLQVKNAIGGTVNSDLSTTKQDSTQHGFGLASMGEIARRHGGSLEAVAKDGRFTLLVCFPCNTIG